MSTLTKILIVLLTLSSIFLCGIIVTYVANADNYRQMYIKLKVEYDIAVENEGDAKKQLNTTIEDAKEQERKLNSVIAGLESDVNDLDNELTKSDRQKVALIEEAGKWKAITREFYDTNEKQGQWLEDVRAELKKIQLDQIQSGKELKETTAALIEKMTIIETLEKQSRLLLEEKTYLQNELDKLLRQSGKAVAPPEPVTPIK